MKKTSLLESEFRSKRFIPVYFIIYNFSWFTSLIEPRAIYWDDWQYFQDSPTVILGFFDAEGWPWYGWLQYYVLRLNPIAFSIITYLAYFLSGIALHGIAARTSSLGFILSPRERAYLATVFAVLPLNPIRHTENVGLYSVFYLSFFLAWNLALRRNHLGKKIDLLTLSLFSFSFILNSFLFFYLLPMIHLLLSSLRTGISLKSFLRSHVAYLVLPIVWYGFKRFRFPAYGAGEGYLDISKKHLLAASIALLALTIVYYTLHKSFAMAYNSDYQESIHITFISLFCIVVAIFPYFAVGRPFPFREMAKRNEILLPLGLALLIICAYRIMVLIIGRKFGNLFIVFVLAFSSVCNTKIGLDFVVDWRKQEVILDWIKANQDKFDVPLVLVHDSTQSLNALHREYRYYEWTGFLRTVKGNKETLGISANQYPLLRNGTLDPVLELAGYAKPTENSARVDLYIENRCYAYIEYLLNMEKCLAFRD